MHVHALEQLGTFVMAWPMIRQCLLCSGMRGLVHLHRFMHTHSHTQTFPWIPRVEKGLNRNLGHAGILNPLNQKKPFTPQPDVTGSTFLAPVSYLRHSTITRNILIHILVCGHRSDPSKYQPLLSTCAPYTPNTFSTLIP